MRVFIDCPIDLTLIYFLLFLKVVHGSHRGLGLHFPVWFLLEYPELILYRMEQLGHSSIKITVDIHGHWIPGGGREGLEDALLGGVQKPHIIAYKHKRPQ